MKGKQQGKYFSGTSGLLLPVRNKAFYPLAFQSKSRLNYYASLFNSIEINSSFYKIPRIPTVERWATDVPEDFTFTFKLYRELTHNKGLAFDALLIEKFLQTISVVDKKSACLLIQFPPSVKGHYRLQVQNLLETVREIDSYKQWKVAVEFRDAAWYKRETYDLLHQLEMALVIHDKLSVANRFVDTGTDFIYVRFHGPNGNYRGKYDEYFLNEYALYIQEWLYKGKDVYVYFNNTMGDAIANLVMLRDLVNNPL